VAREGFGDVRAEMQPAAVAARYDHGRIAARAVQVQRLRAAANHQRVLRVGWRGLGLPELREPGLGARAPVIREQKPDREKSGRRVPEP
jgi:hypothetical protein